MTKFALAIALAGIVGVAASGIAYVQNVPDNVGSQNATSDLPQTPQLPGLGFNLTWNGYYKLGLADCVMLIATGICPAHTYETEQLVEPLAKVGFRVDIPENVSHLEFDMRWQGNERLHLLVHAPMKSDHSMPSYMAMGGKPGRLCISIPADEIVSGMWEVMAHAGSVGYQDTPFTIHVNGEGASGAKIRSGQHGHPIQEDWSMDGRESKPCLGAP